MIYYKDNCTCNLNCYLKYSWEISLYIYLLSDIIMTLCEMIYTKKELINQVIYIESIFSDSEKLELWDILWSEKRKEQMLVPLLL